VLYGSRSSAVRPDHRNEPMPELGIDATVARLEGARAIPAVALDAEVANRALIFVCPRGDCLLTRDPYPQLDSTG